MTREEWIDTVIDEAISTSDQTHPMGKAEAMTKFLRHLSVIENHSERMRFIERVAERLHIDMNLIREEINKTKERQ